MKYLQVATTFVLRIFTNVERKHLPLIAAGLAYYFILSLFPTLVVLAAVVAYLPLNEGMQGVIKFLGYVIPPQAASLFDQFLATIRPHRTGLLSFGIIVTIWLSSKAVKGIIAGLDMVYEVRVPRRLWTNRILAFGLTFGVGVLLLLGLVLTWAGPVIEALLERAVPVQSLWIKVWPYLQWIPAAIFIFAAIELLYLLAPNLPARQRVTIPGALAASVAWLALSWGLGFYFQHFGGANLDRSYEYLATPIAVMVWLYWSAFAILIGAEINASLQSYKSSEVAGVQKGRPPHKMDAA
jgi:membrane protein